MFFMNDPALMVIGTLILNFISGLFQEHRNQEL